MGMEGIGSDGLGGEKVGSEHGRGSRLGGIRDIYGLIGTFELVVR